MDFRLNDSRLGIIRKAYTVSEDLEKLGEESLELAKALEETSNTSLDDDDKARSEVMSEMADVYVMIQRVLRSLEVSDEEFGIYYEYKVRRQLDRLRRRGRRAEAIRIDKLEAEQAERPEVVHERRDRGVLVQGECEGQDSGDGKDLRACT